MRRAALRGRRGLGRRRACTCAVWTSRPSAAAACSTSRSRPARGVAAPASAAAARRGRRGGCSRRVFDIGAGRARRRRHRRRGARWPRGRIRRLSGAWRWTSRRAPTGARRSHGRFEWRAEDGRAVPRGGRPAHARTPQARLAGRDRRATTAPTCAVDADSTRPGGRRRPRRCGCGARWATREAAAAGASRATGRVPRPLAGHAPRPGLRGTLHRPGRRLPRRRLGARGVGRVALDAARGALAARWCCAATAASCGSTAGWRRGASASEDALDVRVRLRAGPPPTSRAPWAGTLRPRRAAHRRGDASAGRRSAPAARRAIDGARRPLPRRALRGPASWRPRSEAARPRSRAGPARAWAAGASRFRGTRHATTASTTAAPSVDGRRASASPRRSRRACAGAAASPATAHAPGHADAAAPAARACARRASSWATRAWARWRPRLRGTGDGARRRSSAPLPLAARGPGARGQRGRGRALRGLAGAARRARRASIPFLRALVPGAAQRPSAWWRAGERAPAGPARAPAPAARGRRLDPRALQVLLPDYPVRNREPVRSSLARTGTLSVARPPVSRAKAPTWRWSGSGRRSWATGAARR